jgi:hypothetical protein
LDCGIKDELFADVDNRRDQAMNPAMATRPHAQMFTASTMGTAESLALNMAVETGREAVEAGRSTGVAYFEWSADEDDDPGDPATWWRCMPALGRTITLEVVEHAYQTLPIGEFKRAYLNIPTATDERVIPQVAWDAVCSPSVEATADVFALDVNPERTAAGIVAVGAGPVVEVVDYRTGVAWLVDRCEEIHGRYGASFVADKNGPAGGFIEELERRELPVLALDSRDMQHASGGFFDAVIDGGVQVRQNGDLDAAVACAAKRPVGDSWVWGRKSSRGDVSLLVAASMGLWVVLHPEAVAEPSISFI